MVGHADRKRCNSTSLHACDTNVVALLLNCTLLEQPYHESPNMKGMLPPMHPIEQCDPLGQIHSQIKLATSTADTHLPQTQ